MLEEDEEALHYLLVTIFFFAYTWCFYEPTLSFSIIIFVILKSTQAGGERRDKTAKQGDTLESCTNAGQHFFPHQSGSL